MHALNNTCRKLAFWVTSIIGSTVLMLSCNKDNNPTQVSEKSTTRYQLPQGSASFDAEILNLFQKYDSYILYKFSDIDFNYQFSYNFANPPVGSLNAVVGPVVMRGGDSIAIQSALDFMNTYWFNFYPEDFKKKYLPQKILLAGLIYTTRYNGSTKIYDTPRVNPYTIPIEGVDHITLPKIDTAFISYPLASKLLLKAKLNSLFLKHLMYPVINTIPAPVPVPDAFFKVSDYSLGSIGTTRELKYKYGFDTILLGSRAPTPIVDMVGFLDSICAKSKSQLDAYMLNPNVDVLGLTRRKYELLVNYFKTNYNVDIQAIGNKQD
jgi:hypothetical protein